MEDNKFGKALAELLDGTGVFTREKWAIHLYVSTSAISQWVNGKTMPRADYLNAILSHLERFKGTAVKEKLSGFYNVIDQPIAEVLPKDLVNRVKGVNTISDYISNIYIHSLQYEINNLPGSLRKSYTFLCSSLSRRIQELIITNRNPEFIDILNETINHMEDYTLKKSLSESLSECDHRNPNSYLLVNPTVSNKRNIGGVKAVPLGYIDMGIESKDKMHH